MIDFRKRLQANRLYSERAELVGKLKDMDYIGTKIATGRAKKTDYAGEIATMQRYAERINEIDAELAQLKEQA